MTAERRLIDHYAAVRKRCYGRPQSPQKAPQLPKLVYKPATVLKFVPKHPPGTWQSIVAEVCVKHGITWGTMMMPAHLRKFSHKKARWEAWSRLRREYTMPGLDRRPTLQDIATMFGLSDHSTISYGLDQWAVILEREKHDQLQPAVPADR